MSKRIVKVMKKMAMATVAAWLHVCGWAAWSGQLTN